jgi:hypothetical protein
MKELMDYLPLLNLLVIPVFASYLKIQIRLARLEIHKQRVEVHLGFNERRGVDHGA